MNRLTLSLLTAVLFTNFVAAQQLGAPGERKGSGTVVIKAARIIDGLGGRPIRNGGIVVSDDKIIAIGPLASIRVPVGSRTIDLGDATLMPGFFDLHTHITGRTLGDPEGVNAAVRDYESFAAILAVENARKTLMAGFTTIRNLGADRFDDLALRKAINDGFVDGPRVIAAGHSLGITGGHCDENGYRPGLADGSIRNGIADGPDEVRAAVRYQVKYGADIIKTCATAGVLSEGLATVGTTQYTFEELKAMVDEAAKLERKVAAHAHGTEGIKIATRAGVASIEHGSFLDEEGARLMAQRGTYLVPTLMAGEAVEKLANSDFLKGNRKVKALAAATAMRRGIRLAVANRVPIALGTDAGVIPHGTNGREFTLMVEWGGMRPMDAIVAGTMSAAKLAGMDSTLGSLSAGKVADIVAVSGDPIADIRKMESTIFVMKNGRIYKER
ncbi:MAG TPA: amidohydrolase family protein [Pyrinomonadaceae bacterium]|nr:amidohydrolase family protein [Pyrinomonadaceae bacterium]